MQWTFALSSSLKIACTLRTRYVFLRLLESDDFTAGPLRVIGAPTPAIDVVASLWEQHTGKVDTWTIVPSWDGLKNSAEKLN